MSKLENLKTNLRNLESCLLAYSGGVDSSFLMAVARQTLRKKFVAATVRSLLNERETVEDAGRRAALLGVRHEVVELDLKNERKVVQNPSDRCYHCKIFTFSTLKAKADELGLAAVIDATHTDDLHENRPGLKALEELGVRSPLKEEGFTKKEIREYSFSMGLEGSDRPPNPCLATRIPFGTPITQERLRRVAGAERILRSLGFRTPRVRDYGNLARIEVQDDELEKASSWPTRKGIHQPLRDLGYTYVTLDLMGYRLGSMEEALEEKSGGNDDE